MDIPGYIPGGYPVTIGVDIGKVNDFHLDPVTFNDCTTCV